MKKVHAQVNRQVARDEYAAARRTLQAYLKREPDDHRAMQRLSRVYALERRFRLSERWARRALRGTAGCSAASVHLAFALYAQGRATQSTRVLDKLISRKVRDHVRLDETCLGTMREAQYLVSNCLWYRAFILEDCGRLKEAIRDYRAHIRRRERFRFGGPSVPLSRVRRRLASLEGRVRRGE